MNTKFLMELKAWSEGADDPHIDEAIVAEVTAFDSEACEITFKDRNEQMYLRFQLRDLFAAAQAVNEP